MKGKIVHADILELTGHFLKREASSFGEPETVILCGSHAVGRAGPHSDIDLLLIGDYPSFRRERRMFESRLFGPVRGRCG